jgi:glutamine synthetase
MTFVERHGLWTGQEADAAAEAERRIAAGNIEILRLSFADQHGILRGKSVVGGDAAKAMRDGCTVTTSLLAKDTAHRTVFPVFTAGGGFGMREMEGAADALMVADPTTFRLLPWAPRTGWMLCDLYFMDGRPVPFSTRHRYRVVLERLAAAGYDFMAGLEVEFHVFKLLDPQLY